jgi:hypothetical protein
MPMPLEPEARSQREKSEYQSVLLSEDIELNPFRDREGQRRILAGEDEEEDKDRAVALRDRSRSRSPTPEKDEDDDLEEQDDLAIGPTPVVPPGGYTNVRDAEEAFIWLLKKIKVDETWSWDKVMRTIIMEPLYKALNTSAEKKNAYQKVSIGDSIRCLVDLSS